MNNVKTQYRFWSAYANTVTELEKWKSEGWTITEQLLTGYILENTVGSRNK